MRASVAIAMVIGIAACHRAEVQLREHRELGDYSYRTMIGPTLVTGEFTIEADTVTVDAHLNSCRRVDTGILTPEVHPFTCRGGPKSFNVVIDSRRPKSSTWSSTEPVKTVTKVCDRYTVTKNRQTFCASTRTEVVTEEKRVGGLLEVKRIASTEKP